MNIKEDHDKLKKWIRGTSPTTLHCSKEQSMTTGRNV